MVSLITRKNCERCYERPMVLGFLDEEDTTRYHDVPPWCEGCLEEGDWNQYWLEQVKRDYASGKLQS